MVLSTYDRETFGKTMYEDGYEEGIQIGVQQGEQRGEIRGIKKGEAQAQKEIAKNMKAMGFDDNTIAKATGLSKKEIKEI